MIKEVFAPHLNRNVKFGRKRPVSVGPHLKLGNYLKASLPPAPASDDYTPKAAAILADIMGNDQYGDCVYACGYHMTGVETANASPPGFHATLAQVLADYTATTGFNPNDPSTDNGANIQDVLNYWTTHGFADGTKLSGYLAIDATNFAEVQAALHLFGDVILGMELPDRWVNPFPSQNGAVWDLAGYPDPSNGHCVGGFAYGADFITVATWGLLVKLTKNALARYAVPSAGGELWVALTPDQIAKGQAKAPNGVAWNDLIVDFDSIGGHVPVPAPPAPPPPPPPNPVSGGVSLAQAEAAVKAGFAHQPWLMSSGSATKIALKALESLTSWPK